MSRPAGAWSFTHPGCRVRCGAQRAGLFSVPKTSRKPVLRGLNSQDYRSRSQYSALRRMRNSRATVHAGHSPSVGSLYSRKRAF